MDSLVKSSDLGELQQRLRSAGLRATAPRVAVLRLLMHSSSPVTHAEVAERVASSGFDRATIYRNLMDLTARGFVRRADVGDHVWRFELVRDAGHEPTHPHFVCNECGTVACLPAEAVTVRPVRGAPRAFKRPGIQIQVSGVCNDCG